VTILRIEHRVPDYEAWKQVFDGDPLDRKGSGVRRHSVYRRSDDPNVVAIDLEFETTEQAEQMRAKLIELWAGMQGTIITEQQAYLAETVETLEY